MTVPAAAEAAEGALASTAGSAAAGAARQPKWGPGSRGRTAGRPKAADALAARKAAAAEPAATPAAEPAALARPAAGGDADPAGGGGFLAGLREGAAQGRSLPARGAAVRDGSAIVLGFLGWVWVVLPYLNGGLPRVKAVLAAKFLNQTTGGGK